MRILITGMGGELGTRVANLLEADPAVEEVGGIDIDPPRRRLRRAEFWRVDPRDELRTRAVVTEFAPEVLVHIGTYEPYARSSPRSAVARTEAGTRHALNAAVAAGNLRHVVVRSGIEIYGRTGDPAYCPDEDAPTEPTTPWGESLLHAELVARELGRRGGATVTRLRFAPMVGPHFPSPLGRLLRMPVIPMSPRDPSFSVVHQEDAARALVAAVHRPHDGALNVVAPGGVTVGLAASLGRRIALPVVGPAWKTTRLAAELAGSPIPAHIQELLVRGALADGSRVKDALGMRPKYTTHEVIERLYEWSEVTYLTVTHKEVA